MGGIMLDSICLSFSLKGAYRDTHDHSRASFEHFICARPTEIQLFHAYCCFVTGVALNYQIAVVQVRLVVGKAALSIIRFTHVLADLKLDLEVVQLILQPSRSSLVSTPVPLKVVKLAEEQSRERLHQLPVSLSSCRFVLFCKPKYSFLLRNQLLCQSWQFSVPSSSLEAAQFFTPFLNLNQIKEQMSFMFCYAERWQQQHQQRTVMKRERERAEEEEEEEKEEEREENVEVTPTEQGAGLAGCEFKFSTLNLNLNLQTRFEFEQFECQKERSNSSLLLLFSSRPLLFFLSDLSLALPTRSPKPVRIQATCLHANHRHYYYYCIVSLTKGRSQFGGNRSVRIAFFQPLWCVVSTFYWLFSCLPSEACSPDINWSVCLSERKMLARNGVNGGKSSLFREMKLVQRQQRSFVVIALIVIIIVIIRATI